MAHRSLSGRGRPTLVSVESDPGAPTAVNLLTSHGQALLWLVREPTLRIREIADRIGTSERRAQTIVNDLVRAGLVRRRRVGRRNRYEVPSADVHDELARAVVELGDALDGAASDERLAVGSTRPVSPRSVLPSTDRSGRPAASGSCRPDST